jgi:hypothetical protein
LGTVPYTVGSLDITALSAVADTGGATLTIAGAEAVSGAAKTVSLARGLNIIRVIVGLANEGGDVSSTCILRVSRAALDTGAELFVSESARGGEQGTGSEGYPYASLKEALDLIRDSGIASVPDSFVTIILSGRIRGGGDTSNGMVDISGGSYPEIILKGKGSGPLAGVLDAQERSRVLYVADGGRVTLGDNLILTGGSAGSGSGGGGVYVSANSICTMNSGALIRNNSAFYGGGVQVAGGEFIMSGGTLTGNSASMYGGGVYVNGGGSFTLDGEALIRENTGPVRGGGIYVTGGSCIIQGGAIENNTASSGGGIYINGDSSTCIMSGGAIQENEEGGIYVSGGDFTLSGGTILGNAGSGVCLSESGFTMSGGTVQQNRGSGVHIIDSVFTMNEGAIQKNQGSGVFVDGASGDSTAFTMNGGIISGNTMNSSAINSGGGGVSIYGSKSAFILNDGTIQGNTALSASRGGGVFVSGGSFTMTGGIIRGNTSASYGGGVHLYNASTVFHKTGGTITGGDASSGPSSRRNTAGGDAQGHAVSALNASKIRTRTAGPDVELHMIGGRYTGGWD